MKRICCIMSLLLCLVLSAKAQVEALDRNGNPIRNNGQTLDGNPLNPEFGTYEDGAGNRTTWGRDTTRTGSQKKIPIGQFQWILEPRLGTVVDAENNDTVVHDFQKWNDTGGFAGEFNYLGNMGAPRLNRIYFNRPTSDEFIFLQPFDFFRGSLQDFRYTNTKSPITNLAYHSCGNKQIGEDRVRGYFATNINKEAGLGFKIDYSYGTGYYYAQPNSMFGTTFYGYYRGERYNVHAYAGVNHLKMGENGGIEDDRYIEDPLSFRQEYSAENIPTMLSQTWNRNHEQHFYLTHRYNIGFTRLLEVPDSLKPTPPSEGMLLAELPDSVKNALNADSVQRKVMVDSLMQKWNKDNPPPHEFVPVTSIIHTFDLSNLKHEYLAHNTTSNYYTNHYYGDWGAVEDVTRALSVRNTFGVALREGFNKWAKMGITLFGTHKLRSYKLMDMQGSNSVAFTENDVSVGGEVARTQGNVFHYNASGEVWLIGPHAGDLDIKGSTNLDLRLGRLDSLVADVNVNFAHSKPSFFFRHYHSQSTWWDNDDLSREVRFKVGGTLRLGKLGTRLNIGFENVSNYTYFSMENTLHEKASANSLTPTDFSHAVSVRQAGSVQVFGATLSQDLKWKFIHLDSQVSYQKSTDQDALPLPTFNAYTNFYLLFRMGIRKILRVQIGGDLRYFTSYYGPDYSPSIQQFAVQDANHERMKVGGYPIIGAYANLHLKHCRIYVNVRHVNAGSGHAFLVPHYPINPMTINMGLSWNFFN